MNRTLDDYGKVKYYDGRFETLEEMMKAQSDSYNLPLIRKAYDLCVQAHAGQKRSSGEPFYLHPFSVACIIVQLGMDSESVAAALLHDVVEDTPVTAQEVEKAFGKDIAMLVDGVTKIGRIPFITREEQQAENIRKMLLAMAEDIRVIIIKLADRLNNMRTIGALPEQKQRDKALETLEIYAPIAHRLGIRPVKEELEDLSIATLDPVAYREIEQSLSTRKQYREALIESIKNRIQERVSPFVPDIYIEGRIKSIHGIYRKMYVQGKSFEEIYDIYAVRIITGTVNDCYNILGIIHDIFRPIPGRFKDYISTPKPNMYQSLHTTVIGPRGHPVRGADPHLGYAPHGGVRHRRALEVQGGRSRPPSKAGGTKLALDPAACLRLAEGRRRRATRFVQTAENRPLCRRMIFVVYAQGRRRHAPPTGVDA